MTTRDDVHCKAGEALSLAQALELALTVPIMMLSLLESGHAKDLTAQDVVRMIREDKARERSVIKSKVMDEKLQERMRMELTDIAMLVRNGSMGALKTRLQGYLRSSPGGPSAPLTVLEDALEARNYLCHQFFKDVSADLEQGHAVDHVVSKLDEMQDAFRAAISFCDRLTEALRQAFPKTFDRKSDQIH